MTRAQNRFLGKVQRRSVVPSGGTCGSTGEDDERRRRVNRQAGTDGRGPSRGGGATPLWEHGVKDCFLVRRAKGSAWPLAYILLGTEWRREGVEFAGDPRREQTLPRT